MDAHRNVPALARSRRQIHVVEHRHQDWLAALPVRQLKGDGRTDERAFSLGQLSERQRNEEGLRHIASPAYRGRTLGQRPKGNKPEGTGVGSGQYGAKARSTPRSRCYQRQRHARCERQSHTRTNLRFVTTPRTLP